MENDEDGTDSDVDDDDVGEDRLDVDSPVSLTLNVDELLDVLCVWDVINNVAPIDGSEEEAFLKH